MAASEPVMVQPSQAAEQPGMQLVQAVAAQTAALQALTEQTVTWLSNWGRVKELPAFRDSCSCAVATPDRGLKRQSDSPGSSVTKFFRLDYMFGKSSEKVAKQPVQPLSPAQQQALVSLEPAADSAAVVLPPRNRKGGRPRGSGRRQKRQAPGVRKQRADPTAQAKLSLRQAPGVRKQRADPTAQAKLSLSKELTELQQQPGVSKGKARQVISQKYGLSLTAVRNLEKTDTVAQLKQYVEQKKVGKHSLRRAGSHLALNKLPSKAQGSRIAAKGNVLGRKDRCRVVWMTTALRAQHEESQQHLLSLADLVRDYEYRLQQATEQRQKLEYLTASQNAELDSWKQKLHSLQTKKKQRDREAVKLAERAGLRERVCQQTQNVSQEV
eukprot:s296_g40.t1